MVAILLALVRQACQNVVVHFGRFLTLDPKCTGTFWMVSMGLQLTCFIFDPKCTGTFWTVSPFDTKCTGTFWASRQCPGNVLDGLTF